MDNLILEAEANLAPYFKKIEEIEEYNFNKVLKNFISSQVAEHHFSWVSGYGHDDIGREKLDELYAKIFNTEAGIVRPGFASGTHVISCCLFGLLRPGDELLSIAGKPYDSLHEVIGINSGANKNGSLTSFGIKYKEMPLKDNFLVDLNSIENFITNKTKVVFIQRSKGYEWRKSLSIIEIEKIIEKVKKANKNIICFVDNCFGEFTEKFEQEKVEYAKEIKDDQFLIS